MRAIVNATPLIALALVDQLELLRQIFDQVIVPESVYNEVSGHGSERPGAEAIAQAIWLQIETPQTRPTIEPVLMGLDQGELDVLLLAQETQPDWVIIDERLGRRAARALGLPLKGTVGVLLTAGLAGLRAKSDLMADMSQMMAKGIRLSPHLHQWLQEELERAGVN